MPWWLEALIPVATGAAGLLVGLKLKGKAPPGGSRLR